MRIVLGIAIAGFLGTITRYEIGLLFPQSTSPLSFPWATLFINLSGTLMLGYLFGRLSRLRMPEWVGEVVGTGFIGSYTTFSAFNGQLWELLEHHAYVYSAAYVLLSGVGGWLLAVAGLAWGRGKPS
ncbi:fluoride efflux transporter FluC [Cohnella abietis]|uniref:Fluoride-specific ion channel FluC n=1 Tax=Cohnella abietis TaxID=2507935 RepID=A0A3T1D903_9BACL|nr:CrcB family protein [Cohnella abietis]BBI34577.1 putative fluoride ion transporter CrcB 1 [Cohnella abietis]